jgi:DinB superfamily
MMEFGLPDTIALLTRTPAVLNALLRDLPETWALANEGADTWRPFDIVGHLVHGERTDWMPRARMILQSGERQTFAPFDRLGHVREMQGKSLEQLLEEFTSLRSQNLAELRALNLGPEALARRGRHPALGEVTLAQLLATWPVHDLTHLHQISRGLARQYQQAVGPWSAYLGVLHCAGHGA